MSNLKRAEQVKAKEIPHSRVEEGSLWDENPLTGKRANSPLLQPNKTRIKELMSSRVSHCVSYLKIDRKSVV